ncbi:hypothetical protein FIBSPDRAFT_863665 [Athelia psychrophila]|uniref:Uncharacterized protein n=1 Tax=Athelia psychrophila TaxID=1759441 RepID=A0A166H2V6_9AGAM|nr:hypothetical protein FIBSPDRAFT_863665 [Fibularhizoctonia sp. CBS 109695]
MTERLLADMRLLCPPMQTLGVDCRISMPSASSLPSTPNTSSRPRFTPQASGTTPL